MKDTYANKFDFANTIKSLRKFDDRIADAVRIDEDEYHYDVFLKHGWEWDSCDPCRQTEFFRTVAEARAALRAAHKVPVERCKTCPHYNAAEDTCNR